MTYVYAGTHAEYRYFIDKNRDKKFRYVVGVYKLIGITRGSTLILLGTWKNRTDKNKILLYAKTRDMRIITKDGAYEV